MSCDAKWYICNCSDCYDRLEDHIVSHANNGNWSLLSWPLLKLRLYADQRLMEYRNGSEWTSSLLYRKAMGYYIAAMKNVMLVPEEPHAVQFKLCLQ